MTTKIDNLDGKAAIARAHKEIAEERMELAVKKLKDKLQERNRAQTILDNVDREIADLELAIEQGNA